MKLKDKVSIITGAGRGIGRAIALGFAKEGARTVLVSRTEKELNEVANEVEKLGSECLVVNTDVSVPQEIDRLVEKTLAEYGTIDVLVNNAAKSIIKPIVDCTLEDWDSVINTNLRGLWYLTKVVSKTMIEKKSGKIINIASITGVVGFPDQSIYAAAKGGVVNLTRELGIELAPYGINVNVICPGITDTPLVRSLGFSPEEKENIESLLKDIPANRIARPEDIARPVVFLASDDANYVCGAILMVDGGWTAH
jgi:NAD(P)-dependent dehydrogenase (short-subunit alcohol dehydrogenase family)